MALVKELRQRARHVVAPVLCVSLVLYFGFHLFQGERGIVAWLTLSKEARAAQTELEKLTREKTELEARVAVLRPDRLDLDALDEQARRMLNLANPSERVILTPETAVDSR